MEIGTLGDLWTYGARIHVRCDWGRREGMKSVRECGEAMEFDLRQLLWTHGKPFPVSRLSEKLKCPQCGSREVAVRFSIPPTTQVARAAGKR